MGWLQVIKIAVCDDEELFQNKIKEKISNYLEEKGCPCDICCFSSGRDLLDKIQKEKEKDFDIVYLDINMEQMDGLVTAAQIREVKSDLSIVFVTSYISYALEGYKVNAFRYILKNPDRLDEMLLESLEAFLKEWSKKQKTMVFDFVEGKRTITLVDVVYIESDLHRLYFHMKKEGKVYSIYDKLNAVEKYFVGLPFLRIHQSYFVNMAEVEQYCRYEMLMKSGDLLSIPKSKYKAVKEAMIVYEGEL